MADRNFLPKIDYDSQDFEEIVTALQTYIKVGYKEYYNDFFTSNLGQALIELLAYLGDQLNYYLNKRVNNLYIDTVERYDAILRLAQFLGYSPTGPIGARVNVCSRRGGASSFLEYPELVDDGDRIVISGGAWSGQDYIAGDSIVIDDLTFEVDESVTIYKVLPIGQTESPTLREQRTVIDPDAPASTIDLIEFFMFEGVTTQDRYTSDGADFQRFESNSASVIQDSWKVRVNAEDWEQATDNTFVKHEVGDKVYTVDYIEGSKIRITFGDGVTYAEKPLESDIINMVYRVGGGFATNISADVLDPNEHSVLGDLYPDAGGSSLDESILLDNVHFLNEDVGAGDLYDYGGAALYGADRQTLTSIKIEAPQYLKSTNRAITKQDIEVLSNGHYDSVSGEQVGKAYITRPEETLRYVDPSGNLELAKTELNNFIKYSGQNIKLYLPSYGANIVRVFIWKLGSLGQPDTASADLVTSLSNYLNKGVDYAGDIGMISVQYLVEAGIFNSITIDLSATLVSPDFTTQGIWFDPVYNPETLTTQIKEAIVSLFNDYDPASNFQILDVWRAVAAIEGILKFSITLNSVADDVEIAANEIANLVNVDTDVNIVLIPKVV